MHLQAQGGMDRRGESEGSPGRWTSGLEAGTDQTRNRRGWLIDGGPRGVPWITQAFPPSNVRCETSQIASAAAGTSSSGCHGGLVLIKLGRRADRA